MRHHLKQGGGGQQHKKMRITFPHGLCALSPRLRHLLYDEACNNNYPVPSIIPQATAKVQLTSSSSSSSSCSRSPPPPPPRTRAASLLLRSESASSQWLYPSVGLLKVSRSFLVEVSTWRLLLLLLPATTATTTTTTTLLSII